MAVEFGFSDIESVLVRLNRVAEDKRIAFRARLKHFQRMGFPPGVNTGTGKRAAYTFPMLLMMAFATELTQAGMAPKRIVKTLVHSWSDVEWSLLMAITPGDYWTPPQDNNLLWTLSPEAMRDLSEEGEGEYDYHDSIWVETVSSLSTSMAEEEEFKPVVGEIYRRLVIQLRPFMAVLMGHIVAIRPDIETTVLWSELKGEINEKAEEFRRISAEIDILGRKHNGDDQKA